VGVATLYHQLENRSRVNLRTVVLEIERQGVAWVPSYLKPTEFAAIMNRSAPTSTR
jgi:hypothetical protein